MEASSSSYITNIAMTVVVSICILLVCHYLWNYVLDNFSTKKTKDLVNGQMEKYKKIMGLVNSNSTGETTSNNQNEGDYMDKIDKKDMNDELEQFMNQELSKIEIDNL